MVTVPAFLTRNVKTPASRATPARSHSALVIVLCQTPSNFTGTCPAPLVAAPPGATDHVNANAIAATNGHCVHLRLCPSTSSPLCDTYQASFGQPAPAYSTPVCTRRNERRIPAQSPRLDLPKCPS